MKIDVCVEAASLSGGPSLQTLSHSCSMSPQAGKGWDLFLLYRWGAQAERMGGQREAPSLAQPSPPGMWPQPDKWPCWPNFLPLRQVLPYRGRNGPLKQADCVPAPPQLAPLR